MAQRIFTIVGREGTAIITDSKPKANGNGSFDQLTDVDTQTASLKLLNQKLAIIPRNKKFDSPITFLLSNTISFLAYEDTRTFWIENGYRKNDDKKTQIAPEIINEVKVLHNQLAELGSAVRLFGQKGLTSPTFNNYIRASWTAMDTIVKRETISAEDAF